MTAVLPKNGGEYILLFFPRRRVELCRSGARQQHTQLTLTCETLWFVFFSHTIYNQPLLPDAQDKDEEGKMADSKRSLFEFLQEAGLHQHFASLRDVLHVYEVSQLKYVNAEDLLHIGLSKPETRRLKTHYQKHSRSKYTNKIKSFLLPGAHHQKPKDECLLKEDDPGDAAQPDYEAFRLSTDSRIKVQKQHIISAERISIYKAIGQGEFGIVQQGVLTDINHGTHQIAVKCLSKDRMQNNTDEFMKEFNIMQSMDHPNIVRLFGAVLESEQIMLITELAPLRSLLECLKE